MKHSHFDQYKGENAFGRSCVALRKHMNLTQRELARHLELSEQSIQLWEHGVHLPTQEHLKKLMGLALQRHAFTPERACEEAKQLWLGAGQQTDFEAFWTQMQVQHAAPSALMVLKQDAIRTKELRASQEAPVTPSRFDWGEALEVHAFYGRKQELVQVTRWIEQEHCQVVSVLGMGGIGKSALAVTLMRMMAPYFQAVVFRSVRDAPPCQDLLADCLQVLSPQPLPILPTSIDRCIDLLLECFQTQPCLFVLDNLETLLQEHDSAGSIRQGYEDYVTLLHRVAETPHQSCLLITSREIPTELGQLESSQSSVRTLRLGGLESDACEQLLKERDIVGTTQDQGCLAQRYVGNPLALKIVSETISELFGGEIGTFLEQDMVIFSSIRDMLAEQWTRLSTLEQVLLTWLTIVREPLGVVELHSLLVAQVTEVQVGEALEALQRRSLVEQRKQQATFTLQSVVLEYVTEVLVEQVSEQIQHADWEHLINYALEQAGAKEYVRQVQERLIMAPILLRLQVLYQQQTDALEQLLLQLLNQLRTWDQEAQGYGPANLITLLRLLRGNLRGLDFSHLAIRGAYLQDVEMQDAKLCGAILHDTTLTEALHAIWSVAVSSTGQYWAVGSWQGEVRVWREGGQCLHLVWQAHTDNTFTLAFSPDERTLATGGWDGTIKLWDVQSGSLLWTGWHSDLVFSVVFAPDGQMLASAGNNAIIRFWETSSGRLIQTLASPGGAVYSLAWSPDGQMLAGGCRDGSIRLWQVRLGSTTYARMLAGHSNWVHAVAFAPDGAQLASGSWDNTVKLWDVASGCVLQTLTGHTEQVYDVAWSLDGGTVASSSSDKTIWLWDVAQKRYRAVLHGHTATVYRLAFMPDSLRLLSVSEDSTIRVWDVISGQCVRTLQGYAICLYDLDWSPTSTHLISGSTDGQVILWEVTGKMPPRVMGTHHWVVFGVGWSPDGRLLASSGWDNAIRVWEPTMGTCLHILRDPDHKDTLFFKMAWSPDGRLLACGSYLQGIHVWDVIAHRVRVIERTNLMAHRHIAWSPDGTRLVSGNTDGSVCLWDIAAGTLLQQLLGHHGAVTSVAWSPDGTRLASASGSRNKGELLIWDVQNGECIQAFIGLPNLVSAVTWDLSGDLLVSGGSDGMLRWWDVQQGECIRVRQAHRGTIWSLKRSPNGRWLTSGGDDGAIRIWDVHSTEHVQTLRRDRPYERLNITGIRGLTDAQKSTMRALGAIEDDPVNSI